MHEPDIESLPWSEQQSHDDALYRQQITYLLARSRFYQAKLAAAGFDSAGKIGGIGNIGALPLTEKDELRASRSEADPIGTHLAAPMDDLARIYSTSGTTGTPSYIPLTAGDVENWVRTSARSYAASGVKRGQRIVTTYNAGPFVAGAALELVRARRPLPHSNRHRQHRAPDGGGDAAQAAGHRVHTLLRAAPCRVGQAT